MNDDATEGSTRPAAPGDGEALAMILRVARLDDVAEGVRRFELRADGGAELPAFGAGSHVSVRTPSRLVRKYSLCGDPAHRDRYEIAVRREPAGRGGSTSLFDDVAAGDALEVGEPRNAFPLVEAPAYVFVAGGIGITPIRSMIATLRGEGFDAWRLVYLGRSPATTPFLDEFGGPELASRVQLHFDGADPARAFDLWPLLERPTRAHVYCCGPRALMDAVRDMTGHWRGSSIHFESFVDGAAMARPDDRPFVARLARTGIDVAVPAGTTILEAVRASGVRVPSSCESGTCGSCRTALLAGEAEHRDLVLGPDEHASAIMVCVSRARSPMLLLDL